MRWISIFFVDSENPSNAFETAIKLWNFSINIFKNDQDNEGANLCYESALKLTKIAKNNGNEDETALCNAIGVISLNLCHHYRAQQKYAECFSILNEAINGIKV